MIDFLKNEKPPVIIGGVGGSGTRLIAQCLQQSGYYLGSCLNDSVDNIWFTLLFKRGEILTANQKEFDELLTIFMKAMFGEYNFSPKQVVLIKKLASKDTENHPSEWFQEIAHNLLVKQPMRDNVDLWGWKEPNTHLVLDKLSSRLPGMKYIHVMRNGLDMAYSSNQNQLIQWGEYFLKSEFDNSPYNSLKYWCVVHKRIIEIGKQLGNNFMLLNYDEFCTNPKVGVKQFCDFLGVEDSQNLCELIKAPSSIGRYKEFGLDMFDKEDTSYVMSLGF